MNTNKSQPIEDPLRPHTFDGIQEYDKSLPNWWLFTFYITFVFAIGYWIYYQKTGIGADQHEEYQIALEQLQASVAKFEQSAPGITNDSIRALIDDPAVVAAGQQHYMSNCFPCHGNELQGPPAPGLPGVSLVDAEWLHGNEPVQIHATITNGVLEKGMPGWGPVLGSKRITELTAFILKKQDPSVVPVLVSASSSQPAEQASPESAVPAALADPAAGYSPPANVSNESLAEMSQDAAIVASGQTRYQTLCVACHGANLEGPPAPGLPGVSLVDAEWLHGNEPLQIRKTITHGVIEKGMVPWLAVVGEDGANELVAFILSKQAQ
jgi:cytochrome c oxidase cbb3-type subunit 3